MTGWIKKGKGVHQREKIYALIREQYRTVYEIAGLCWKSGDVDLQTIKPPTIRRCLQELRDNSPQMATKDEVTLEWKGLVVAV